MKRSLWMLIGLALVAAGCSSGEVTKEEAATLENKLSQPVTQDGTPSGAPAGAPKPATNDPAQVIE